MEPIVECVPNFSEGIDKDVINQISQTIESVAGVKLLNVDPGSATNRTVMTFVGHPDKVIEAAFLSIKKAGELIDMRKHKGEHPRIGATDVCPLIPIANITLEETAEYARQLAKRVAEELSLPVYLYEAAQTDPKRANLSVIRAGEYEGFFAKIKLPEWKPDFGPAEFDYKRGATIIGARDFLVAFNINLNTTSVRRANAIAFDVREAGRVKREGDQLTGRIVKDQNGIPVNIPGSLKSVKAIGWFIKEYDIAQISMNLTDINTTPVHIAFDEVCNKASSRGIRVTGSELIGLIPLQAMLEAGRYFLHKQKRSSGISDGELIKIAIRSMGLNELSPFVPKERIIEYMLETSAENTLIGMNLEEFATETASESPAPGGGSVAAYVGALGISLATMVANLSAHKKGWDDRWKEFSDYAETGQQLKKQLLNLVDKDTQAFNKIMEALSLPNSSGNERKARNIALQAATKTAIEVPLQVMEVAHSSMLIIKAMATNGNPASVSDAGVGALCARSATLGAYLNVLINIGDCTDSDFVTVVKAKAESLKKKAVDLEVEILEIVYGKIISA